MANYLLSANTTAIRKEGGWVPGTYGGNDASVSSFSAAALRFKATASAGTIDAKLFQDGSKWALYKKAAGVWTRVGVVTVPNTSTWADTSLFSGLDTSNELEYLLVAAKGGQYLSYITVGSLNTATLTARATLGWYGDSLVAAVAGTSNDASLGDPFSVSQALDMACESRGVGGTTVMDSTTGNEGEVRYADVTSISPAPAKVLIRYGLNDSGQIGGAETAGQLQTAYTNMLTSLTVTLTTTVFYCESIPITTAGGYPTRTTWDAAISAAVTAVNTLRGNSNCRFISILGWSEYTAQTSAPAQTTDGVHPNALGYSLITNREIPMLATTGYTVSLSASSGIVGTPITITYTRSGGSTWITGETVATDDAASGTFGAFTFTPGQTTATRTYTPASAGAKTLTHTNSQNAWTDPSTSAYTATAASTGGRSGRSLGLDLNLI